MKYLWGFICAALLLSAPFSGNAASQTPEAAIAATEAMAPMQIMAAAAAGEPAAQYLLGRNALFGPKEYRDAESAWFWIHGAADMNFPPAQFLMAYICASGIGMSKNQESAQAWLELAAKNGNEMAKRVLAGETYKEALKAYLPANAPEEPAE